VTKEYAEMTEPHLDRSRISRADDFQLRELSRLLPDVVIHDNVIGPSIRDQLNELYAAIVAELKIRKLWPLPPLAP
jgi:hypothetical protein